MAEEHDPIFLNRYVQEDSDGGLSDEEAEMAAYLAAKSEAPITEAEWKNDKVSASTSLNAHYCLAARSQTASERSTDKEYDLPSLLFSDLS